MFGILILVGSSLIAGTTAQAHRYPAGVDPASCPNYPLCDRAFVPAHTSSDRQAAGTAMSLLQIHEGGGHAPFYSSPGFFGPQAAPGYPVGLSPSACPNYPYCSHHIPHAVHYNHGYAGARSYPAGVSAHHCPNYPFCH
ncbi:uncharacterized protein [Bemisia tabaci]|uniref:uncharacterized protein n=1 Tax=Bemisia tabaci TaxID=7038 RepID=UPI0008F99E06|nr:PREDICTED: cuticle protein 1-like [Bemisia tabaci]